MTQTFFRIAKLIKDVFGFWKIKGAELSGKYEIPFVHGTSKIPCNLVSFTDCEKEENTKNKAVHFYQYDEKFENYLESEQKLRKKLKTFKKFQSVILPDYSIYRDMPLAQQIFQVYKSRSVGNFLMQNEISVIPNVRWGDKRTYDFAFDGIDKWGVVCVGVQGGYKNKNNSECFEKGFYKMLEILEPETILCYGNLSESLKTECKYRKIAIKQYRTEISKVKWKKDLFQQELPFAEFSTENFLQIKKA